MDSGTQMEGDDLRRCADACAHRALQKHGCDNSTLSLVTKEVDTLTVASVTSGARHNAAINYYLEATLAPNTIRAYQSDLRMFLQWGASIPCSPEDLASYLADQASVLSPFTLARRLSAIRRAHKLFEMADPTAHPLVSNVMRGMWRRHGRLQRQARTLHLHELSQMLPAMLGRKGARDRALILLGFRAALRRSELCNLNVEDLGVSEEGVLLHIRQSKTDQQSKGRAIAIPFAKNGPCAVRSLLTWLEESHVVAGAVFPSIDRGGRLKGRLPAQAISAILCRYARAVGVEACGLSAHSLRAGFVTTAARAGVSMDAIQRQTGHRSIEMVYRYVRTGNPFSGNANEAIS
ncbi:MAG: site-specific integrase [Luteimonas sp.]